MKNLFPIIYFDFLLFSEQHCVCTIFTSLRFIESWLFLRDLPQTSEEKESEIENSSRKVNWPRNATAVLLMKVCRNIMEKKKLGTFQTNSELLLPGSTAVKISADDRY